MTDYDRRVFATTVLASKEAGRLVMELEYLRFALSDTVNKNAINYTADFFNYSPGLGLIELAFGRSASVNLSMVSDVKSRALQEAVELSNPGARGLAKASVIGFDDAKRSIEDSPFAILHFKFNKNDSSVMDNVLKGLAVPKGDGSFAARIIIVTVPKYHGKVSASCREVLESTNRSKGGTNRIIKINSSRYFIRYYVVQMFAKDRNDETELDFQKILNTLNESLRAYHIKLQMGFDARKDPTKKYRESKRVTSDFTYAKLSGNKF